VKVSFKFKVILKFFIDVEINSEELIDEEIEWENEVLGSPQITEEKIERNFQNY